MNFLAVMKDQGWGNPTWGIYIKLEGMNGENLLSNNLPKLLVLLDAIS